MMTHSGASKNKTLEQIPISHSFSNKLVNCEIVFCWWGENKNSTKNTLSWSHLQFTNSHGNKVMRWVMLLLTLCFEPWEQHASQWHESMKAWKHQLMWEVGLVTHSTNLSFLPYKPTPSHPTPPPWQNIWIEVHQLITACYSAGYLPWILQL